MNVYDATEVAYKNGYTQGKQDALENIVPCPKCISHNSESCPPGRVWCSVMKRYMKETDFCSCGERGNKQC